MSEQREGAHSWTVSARLAISLSLAGCAVLLGACTGVKFEAVPGSNQSAPGASATQTTDATSAVPAELEWPEGFPADFPVPGGNLVQSDVVARPGVKTVLAVRLNTAQTVDDVTRFYMTEPQKSGWTVEDAGEREVAPGQPARFIYVNNDSYHGVVMLSSLNGLTTIGLNVTVENP